MEPGIFSDMQCYVGHLVCPVKTEPEHVASWTVDIPKEIGAVVKSAFLPEIKKTNKFTDLQISLILIHVLLIENK